MLSFWDKNSFIQNDLIVVGGGIVGLSVACSVKEKLPHLDIQILERGLLPTGASTKNAGFAITDLFEEFLENVGIFGEKKGVEMFDEYLHGRRILERRLTAQGMGFKKNGLYQMYKKEGEIKLKDIQKANQILQNKYNCQVFELIEGEQTIKEKYGFNTDKIKQMVVNHLNGTIDTGKTMKNLILYAQKLGIRYITGAKYLKHTELQQNKIEVEIQNPVENTQNIKFITQKLVFCTNGFTETLVKNGQKLDIKPRRGQVIVTKPIKNLKWQGAYDLEEHHGYYFRDYENRIILGGARMLDEEAENTDKIEVNPKITQQLEQFLKEYIVPDIKDVQIDFSWAGIMAFPKDNRNAEGKGTEAYAPVIKEVEQNVYVCARLAGSGVARSSAVGEIMAEQLYQYKNSKL